MAHGLQKVLHDLVSRKNIPHAVIAAALGDGSFQWTGAIGNAAPDRTAMTEDTPFFIASIDKLLTAAVVLKLCERDHIKLDEPIAAYLTDRLIGGIHRLRGVDYTDSITVRHLLGHTSGLADWLEDRPKDGGSIIERLFQDGDVSMNIYDMLSTVRDRLSPHFRPQPVEVRRQKVRYSDTNFILLIAIIEAVTGKQLHEVHEELLFRPLGMHHTWLAGYSRPSSPGIDPSSLWIGRKPLNIPRLMRSTWAIYSTARDTLKFMSALIHGDIFDTPETLNLMQRKWNRFGLPLDRVALRLPTWPIEYGLGMMRFHDPILGAMGRLSRIFAPIYPAPAVIGHTGSTGSWLFYCPQMDLFFSGTVDQANAGPLPYRLVPKILRLFDDCRKLRDKDCSR